MCRHAGQIIRRQHPAVSLLEVLRILGGFSDGYPNGPTSWGAADRTGGSRVRRVRRVRWIRRVRRVRRVRWIRRVRRVRVDKATPQPYQGGSTPYLPNGPGSTTCQLRAHRHARSRRGQARRRPARRAMPSRSFNMCISRSVTKC
jgi:hypothetical protein